MGTPEFAATALRALIAAGHEIAAVYSQPPRPAGRGYGEKRSAVHEFAAAAGLRVFTPVSLKPADEQARFTQLQADAAVVAAYGLLLPPPVLAAPRLGCYNIHASLLPRWRGAAPIHRAIEAGDEHTGITIMQMDSGLDTGDRLLVDSLLIAADDSTATLHDKLAALGGRLVVEALEEAARGGLAPRAQPDAGVSYAHKIDKAEARIDWHQPAAQIERRIRAFDPQPGCHFEHEGEALKVWRAQLTSGFGGQAGATMLEPQRFVVACGDGAALELLEVQRPGGRRQPIQALLSARG